MAYIIPNFSGGEVNGESQSIIDDRRKLKARKLENFYTAQNLVTKRRPPLQILKDTKLSRVELLNLYDYRKHDDVEYYIQGPTGEISQEVDHKLFYTENGDILPGGLTDGTKFIDFSASGTRYYIDLDYVVIGRGDSNKKHIIGYIRDVSINITTNKTTPKENMKAFSFSITQNEDGTYFREDREFWPTINKRVGEEALGNNSGVLDFFKEFTSVEFIPQENTDLTNLPDKLFINDDKVLVKVFDSIARIEDNGNLQNQYYLETLPNHYKISQTPDNFPGRLSNETIHFPSLKLASAPLLIKNTTRPEYTAMLSYKEALLSTDDANANLKRVAELLPSLITPVTTLSTDPNGFVKVCPDVKIKTNSKTIRSIGEQVYTEKIDETKSFNLWSMPERNAERILSDFTTPGGQLTPRTRVESLAVKRVALRDETADLSVDEKLENKTLENLRPIAKARRASWAFDLAPRLDAAYPGGTGTTLFSGIGCVFLVVTNNNFNTPVGIQSDGATADTQQTYNFNYNTPNHPSVSDNDVEGKAKVLEVIYVGYDYSSPELDKWWDDKDSLTLPIATDFGPSGDSKYAISNVTVEKIGTENKNVTWTLGEDDTEEIRYDLVFQTTALTSIRYSDASHIQESGAGGALSPVQIWNSRPTRQVAFGPTYRVVEDSRSVVNYLRNPDRNIAPESNFYGNPTMREEFKKGAVDASTNQISADVQKTLQAPMSAYTTTLIVHDLAARPTELIDSNIPRDIYYSDNHLYFSNHRSDVIRRLSNSEYIALTLSSNIPVNDISKAGLSIPLRDFSSYPRDAPHVLKLPGKITSVTALDDNIYVSTDQKVYRISESTLAADQAPIVKKILDRGIRSELIAESTLFFGAYDRHIITFRYYEEAQRFLGNIINRDFDIKNITTTETLIQNHNIAVFASMGEKELYVLALGQQSKTQGFSRFTFDKAINNIRQLDPDRIIVLFADDEAKILNFNLDNEVDYRDESRDIFEAVTKTKYKSTARCVPILEFSDRDFSALSSVSIKKAIVCMADAQAAFNFFIGQELGGIVDSDHRLKKEVRVSNDSTLRTTGSPSDSKAAVLDIPIVIDSLQENGFVAPYVEIQTDSDRDLKFSSIILDLDVGA